jgi:hypothetical protein
MVKNQELIISEPELQALREEYLGSVRVKVLTQKTDESLIQSRPGRGGGTFDYVEGSDFIVRANDSFGFLWSMEYPQSFVINNELKSKDGEKIGEEASQIVTRGRMTVHVPVPLKKTTKEYDEDGRHVKETLVEFQILNLVKEQYGSSEIKRYEKDVKRTDRKTGLITTTHHKGDMVDLGDDYKGGGTDAFKKCCTSFGMFLDIYSTREKKQAEGHEDGKASSKQMALLYEVGEEAGMDEAKVQEWASKELDKTFEELDELDIITLIPKLRGLKKSD